MFTPNVGTQFQFTPDVMGYASWSKGFKSGGWTTRLSAPIATADIARFNPEFDQDLRSRLEVAAGSIAMLQATSPSSTASTRASS